MFIKYNNLILKPLYIIGRNAALLRSSVFFFLIIHPSGATAPLQHRLAEPLASPTMQQAIHAAGLCPASLVAS